MDLKWGDERKRKFVTSVGLITSRGEKGENIMAAEWTHQVSYSPGLIAVCIGAGKISAENIEKSKEFGVNLAAIDQNVLTSVAGGSHGQDVDKIAVLKDLGFNFSNAKQINALMVDGASFQAECKVVQVLKPGSHIIFIGEIVELYPLSNKESLIYYNHKYYTAEKNIEKPSKGYLDNVEKLKGKHRK